MKWETSSGLTEECHRWAGSCGGDAVRARKDGRIPGAARRKGRKHVAAFGRIGAIEAVDA